MATTLSAKGFCQEALVLQRRLFHLWYRFRSDPTARGAPLTRANLIAHVLPIEKAFFRLGERYLDAPQADVRNLARALFVHHAHLFTFVTDDGVAPTNNSAERPFEPPCSGGRSCSGRAVTPVGAPSNVC